MLYRLALKLMLSCFVLAIVFGVMAQIIAPMIPEGMQLSYTDNRGRLLIYDVSRGLKHDLRQQFNMPDWYVSDFQWSADGQTLVFSAFSPNSPTVSRLFRLDLTTMAITGQYDFGVTPNISPDGNRVLFSMLLAEDFTIGMYNFDTETLEMPFRALAGSGDTQDAPSWSPDGTRFAYIQRDHVTLEVNVYLYDFEQLANQQATQHTADLIGVAASRGIWPDNIQWLPDGSGLIVRATTPPLHRSQFYFLDLTRFDEDGYPRIQWLTNIGTNVHGDLSPDGEKFVFVRSLGVRDSQIYIMNWRDGEPIQLTEDEVRKRKPEFSPDGTLIAYLISNQSEAAFATLRLITPDGQDAGFVAVNTAVVGWRPPHKSSP